MAIAAWRPPLRLSVAMWLTTLAPSARLAMSAVKTGMPALLASMMAVPTALESAGVRMMALTFCAMKSFTWVRCFAGSNSALVTMTL